MLKNHFFFINSNTKGKHVHNNMLHFTEIKLLIFHLKWHHKSLPSSLLH